jgi:predicted anti-sigma-YlaC factor YlaD
MMCERFQESLSAFLDGNCGEAEAGEAFAHCGKCPECRGFLRAAILLQHDVRALPTPAVPPALDRRVLRIPDRERATDWVSRFRLALTGRLHVPVPALAGALGLLVVTLGLSVWLYVHRETAPKQEFIYLVSTPTVEVYGVHASPANNR